MTLTLQQSLEAIATHSSGLAEAATDNLTARVEHCPDWSVAGLVGHVTQVHWFWRTIAGELLSVPPDEAAAPEPTPDVELVETFRVGADALVRTLCDADQDAACWTWFPPRQDVGFITRHQVQEAAVHHWDAGHAVGQEVTIDPAVAEDCVEEFLTCSLADDEDAQQVDVQLGGSLVLHATDTGQWWTVRQADAGSALLWTPQPGEPTVAGTASDLLLWLYGRVPLDEADPALVSRFRRLSSTS